MVSGESHHFEGRRYRLRVLEHDGPSRVSRRGNLEFTVHVRTNTGREKREQVLNDRYRQHPKATVPDLIARWKRVIGVDLRRVPRTRLCMFPLRGRSVPPR
jgi:hypothetical protein